MRLKACASLCLTSMMMVSCFFISYALAVAGMSTAFADVQIRDVPLGKPFTVRSSLGEGIRIRNSGPDPIRVRIQILVPAASDLRGGVVAIPDPHWLKATPEVIDIPGQAEGRSDLVLTVPKVQAFRGKTFQVTIWTHSVPLDGHAMEIGAGLLSKLRFTVKNP